MPPQSAPAPTFAQRAPRWIGYLGVGVYICCLVLYGFDGIGDGYAGYLLIAGIYFFFVLIYLPDRLPLRLKALFCVGSALAGMAITWMLIQPGNPLPRWVGALAPILVGGIAGVLAGRWVRTPAQAPE